MYIDVFLPGAIPSLEATNKVLPAYPAAVVIQGSAMLSSDPLRCQTGTGKVGVLI